MRSSGQNGRRDRSVFGAEITSREFPFSVPSVPTSRTPPSVVVTAKNETKTSNPKTRRRELNAGENTVIFKKRGKKKRRLGGILKKKKKEIITNNLR